MRLALLLCLLMLPGLATADPVRAWADGQCQPEPTENPVEPRSSAQLDCLKKTASSALILAPGYWLPSAPAREWELGRTLEKLRWETASREARMCEVRMRFARLDVATNQLRPYEHHAECQSWVYSWAGHFADALRRADEAALKDNLQALELRAKPGPEPTLRLLAAAKLLAGRGAPQQPPDPTRYNRELWDSPVDELTHVWRLPKQLAALRCGAQQQRGAAVPERCEERVRRALEAELAPVTQELAKAASRLPAKELSAAEKVLAQQERAWAEEQAKPKRPPSREEGPSEGGVVGETVGGVMEGTVGGGSTVNGVMPFGEGMERPERIQGEPIQHSPEALAAGIQGLLIIKFVIQPTGEVTNLRIIKPLPHMDEAVLKTVATWRYKPVLYKGKPIALDYSYPQRLVLPSKP